jgi:glycosyltransferase involved in cell wall biosynthesis
VWIGAGEDERAAQLAGAGVTVTGWLEHDQVADWLAQATVFVQTSHWEALPMALLEAMAAGVPCVATDAAAHRDVIEHGVTGLVATDVDQLSRHVHALLADEPLARRLAEAARRAAAARCSGDVFRERLARLYGLPGAPPAPRPAAHGRRPPAGRDRVPTLSG